MQQTLKQLELEQVNPAAFDGKWRRSKRIIYKASPIDGRRLAGFGEASAKDYQAVIEAAGECFLRWRAYPAPKRGEVVRAIGNELRRLKEPLARLITLEVGKVLPESLGEVQEAIDIADFAAGLSRQLYGKSMHSERAQHRMYEQWQPLGVVGVITAFNFPVAVWAWNAMIAAVCGDTLVWKPSEVAPLSALAVSKICARVSGKSGFPGLFSLLLGQGAELGQKMAADSRLPLISATGSCAMGKSVAQTVAGRLGRSLLELGGNNAVIVLEDADLDLALQAVLFAAVGTAGQRCTTTRRVFMHKAIAAEFRRRLVRAYSRVKIGNPLKEGVMMGPLVNSGAVQIYQQALKRIVKEGGKVIYGGHVLKGYPSALYVEPALVQAAAGMPILKEEIFAPIMFLVEVSGLEQAIAWQNNVPQGLSSAIFTNDLRSAEVFLSPSGSDCGIANVNIGTSGAEIGGAFGGEKETGGGREAGSDAWKSYMRRQTVTVNWGKELPLAQGVEFG